MMIWVRCALPAGSLYKMNSSADRGAKVALAEDAVNHPSGGNEVPPTTGEFRSSAGASPSPSTTGNGTGRLFRLPKGTVSKLRERIRV